MLIVSIAWGIFSVVYSMGCFLVLCIAWGVFSVVYSMGCCQCCL